MNEDDKQKRHDAIGQAAYALLAEHGYAGTSMLRIAKRAKASNETLYRWYGNKDGLFRAMVDDNAAQTRSLLLKAIADRDDPRRTLEKVAPVFLNMLLGERAILLNRAAAADPTGALGAAISAGGRQQIMPLLEQVITQIGPGGELSPAEASRLFLSLLVEDLQIKRVIHECPAPTAAEVEIRCARTVDRFYRLLERT